MMASFPESQKYMNEAVTRLRKFNLTKTEVFSIINLGIGLPSAQGAGDAEAEEMEVDEEDAEQGEEEGEGGDGQEDGAVAIIAVPGEGGEEDVGAAEGEGEGGVEQDDPSAAYLLGLVVEGLEERFPPEQREEMIREILAVLREIVLLPAADGRNGDAAST